MQVKPESSKHVYLTSCDISVFSERSREEIESNMSKDMDWRLHILSEGHNRQADISHKKRVYSTVEKHLEGFKAAGGVPSSLKIDIKLNDGSEIASTLTKNEAKWHNKCRANYNQRMLNRAEKRQYDDAGKEDDSDEGEGTSEKRSRRKSGQLSPPETCTFVCGKPGNLCKASPYQLDSHIWEVALKLGDTNLLAKLSGGDVIAINMMY